MSADTPVITAMFVGDEGVGKTSLGLALAGRDLILENIPTYVGDLKFAEAGEQAELIDCGGAAVYDNLRKAFLHSNDVMLVCFALNSRRSFESVRARWLEEGFRKQYCGTYVILVGCKADHDEEVSQAEVDAFLEEMRWRVNCYRAVSAFSGTGVAELRADIARVGRKYKEDLRQDAREEEERKRKEGRKAQGGCCVVQ